MKTGQLLILTIVCLMLPFSMKGTIKIQDEKLNSDLEKVWPLVQTVTIEFDLAIAQMEFLKTKEEKKVFMEEYEEFVKDKYFKQVVDLNIRQGKLLLLLIDRELGKTPYELLKEYLSLNRANFWQRFAKLVGANLKEEYKADWYPEIEIKVLQIGNLIGKAN